MSWPSIGEQDRYIRAQFPEFKLVTNAGWIAVWEGPLTPIMRRYNVRVIHFQRRFFETWWLKNPYAAVQVVNPVIGSDPRGTGELVPHIYFNQHDPDNPFLCLYDPKERYWTPEEYIADTIIPWTIDWLFFFEAWLDSGEWKGGGRHPERRSDSCPRTDALHPEKHDQREQYITAAFHRLGQRIGSFASFPLMAAASEGSFPPLSLGSWSVSIPVADQSANISTSLPEPPLGVSLPSGWPPGSPLRICRSFTLSADAKSFLGHSEDGLAV